MHNLDFDITPEEADLDISIETLRGIYLKAQQYVSDPAHLLSEIPTLEANCDKFSVVSQGNITRNNEVSHNVLSHEIKCECQCYWLHKVCSHSVAVAQLEGVLCEFFNWHRSAKHSTNSTRRAMTKVNERQVGRKPKKPRRVRNKENQLPKSKPQNAHNICENAEEHETHFFVRCLAGSRIRKCHGCLENFREPPAVPPAPHDMVF